MGIPARVGFVQLAMLGGGTFTFTIIQMPKN